MAIAQKGAISFGLVYIPVDLYNATQDNDVRFNQLSKDSHERVRYVKTCASCKKELKPEDIVKGFQYEKDKYVVIEDKDLEKIKTEKDRSIEILQFADLSEIPSMYFEKSYQVLSQKGGEKPFELLRLAMQEEGKVAIGRTVMGTKQTMVALMPAEDGILLETMYYHDEIRETPKTSARPKVAAAELGMARKLIEGMTRPFEPEQYKDEYQEKLRNLIAQKIEGKEIVVEKSEKPSNVVDLMDALKQSLDRQGKTPAAKPKKPARRKKTG